MKNFAITGVAGYIAPRHLQAIKDTGNHLIAACDPHDSVGILDRYFPDTAFFTEFERFDRHLEMLRRGPVENRIDYVSICSPNHLHDAHIRLALRIGADAICEKPLVLNPWNLDALEDLEREYGKKVYTILQLRLHPAIMELKKKIDSELRSDLVENVIAYQSESTQEEGILCEAKSREASEAGQPYDEKTFRSNNRKLYQVDLTYITSRGLWYDYSWKGVKEKSGGIAMNIGIHFFDMLIWLFGEVEGNELLINEEKKMGGELRLKNADVKWYLSLDRNDLPPGLLENKKTTYRSIKVDGDEVHFHDGFTELHTKVYQETLSGQGFGVRDVRPSIELVHKFRRNNSL